MRTLRIGLCLLLAFGVASFGAVAVWSQSVLEIGAAALLLWWALVARRQSSGAMEWSPLNWPLLGFLAIGIVQIALRISAYPFLTRVELLRWLSYFMVFFLLAQAFQARKDMVRLAWFVIVLCFTVSLFAIIQHFTAGNELYWASGLKVPVQPFGPYINRNHFAGFVELTLPIGLALFIFRGARRELFPLLTLLTIVPISAVVLSSSRGGIIGLVFEIGLLAILAAKSRVALHRRPRWLALGTAALAALSLIAWVGAERAMERFSKLGTPEVTMARRITMAQGALRIFFHFPVAGSGLGTLVDVFPRFETAYDGKLVDHVHDDYLEMLAETGVLGGICGVAFLWLFYREARRQFETEQGFFSRALHGGAIAAVGGLLLHSLVDFNLHIPANALLFLLQAWIATSPALPPEYRMRHGENVRVEPASAAGEARGGRHAQRRMPDGLRG